MGLALAHVALVWNFRTPVIATRQDDAEYVLLSREIARGEYRDSYDVDAPAHAKYPPAYPAFISGLSAVFGERLPVFLFANALLTAGALLLFADRVRMKLSAPAWLIVAGVVALNPETILTSGLILSEALFVFLLYLSLWIETRQSASGTWWATVATSLTTIVRSAGLAVSVGLVGARLFQRRWVAAAGLVLLTATTGGWWAWRSAHAPQASERKLYVSDFQRVLSLDQQSKVSAAVQRVRWKAQELTIDELPTALSIPVIRGHWIDNAIGAAVIVALLPLGLILLWQRWRSAAAILLAYGALYLVWPYGQVRLIVPVIPLILLALFLAAEFLGEKFGRPSVKRWLVPALGIYFVAGLVLRLASERHYFGSCTKGNAPYSQVACFPQEGDWAFVQAAHFVRDSVATKSPVLTVKEPSFFYLSGHKTVNTNTLLKEDSTTLARALRDRGVELVVTANAGPAREQLGHLVATACRDFELVKQFDERTMLLRLIAAPSEPGGPTACDALSVWRQIPRETGTAVRRNENPTPL